MAKASPFAELIEEHYATLRRLATRALRARAVPERMSPTSLVAESVMRLIQQREKPKSEEHLRGLATVFMARVLADHAKARLRLKRGGGRKTRSIDDPSIAFDLGSRSRANDQGNADAPIDPSVLLDAMAIVAEVSSMKPSAVTSTFTCSVSTGPPVHSRKVVTLRPRSRPRAFEAAARAG